MYLSCIDVFSKNILKSIEIVDETYSNAGFEIQINEINQNFAKGLLFTEDVFGRRKYHSICTIYRTENNHFFEISVTDYTTGLNPSYKRDLFRTLRENMGDE